MVSCNRHNFDAQSTMAYADASDAMSMAAIGRAAYGRTTGSVRLPKVKARHSTAACFVASLIASCRKHAFIEEARRVRCCRLGLG